MDRRMWQRGFSADLVPEFRLPAGKEPEKDQSFVIVLCFQSDMCVSPASFHFTLALPWLYFCIPFWQAGYKVIFDSWFLSSPPFMRNLHLGAPSAETKRLFGCLDRRSNWSSLSIPSCTMCFLLERVLLVHQGGSWYFCKGGIKLFQFSFCCYFQTLLFSFQKYFTFISLLFHSIAVFFSLSKLQVPLRRGLPYCCILGS